MVYALADRTGLFSSTVTNIAQMPDDVLSISTGHSTSQEVHAKQCSTQSGRINLQLEKQNLHVSSLKPMPSQAERFLFWILDDNLA